MVGVLGSYQDLFRNLLHTFEEAVCVFDVNFCLTDFNPAYDEAFEAIFGEKPRKGVPIDDLLARHPGELKILKSYWSRALSGETFQTQYGYGVKERRVFEVTYAPSVSNGKVESAFHIAREISREENLASELDKTNKMLSSFFNDSPLMMGIVELRGDDLFHIADNPASLQFFGKSAEEMREKSALSLGVPIPIHEQWVANYKKAKEEDRPVKFSYSHAASEKKMWFQVTVSYLGMGPSGLSRFSYFVEDITSQKEEEYQNLIRQKAENELEFQMLADSMTHLAWLASADGWIYWYNKRWYEYTGTNLSEMQGWGWKKCHHPDHIEKILLFLEEAWKKPEPWELTFPLRGKNGEWNWFLTRAVPIKNEMGEIIRWFGTNTDITKEIKIQEELAFQSQVTKAITDNATSSLFMMDNNGYPTFMNPAAEELTGYKIEEIKDKPLHYAIHYKKPDGSFYPMEECPIDNAQVTLEHVHNHEEIFVDKKGRMFPVSFSVAPLIKEGEIIGSVLEFRDITSEKRRQSQLSELARLSLLLNSGISLEDKFKIVTQKSQDIMSAKFTSLSVIYDQTNRQIQHTFSGTSTNMDIHEIEDSIEKSEGYRNVLKNNSAFRKGRDNQSQDLFNRGCIAIPLISSDGRNIGVIQISDKIDGNFTNEDESILTQLAQIASSAIENTQLLQRETNAVKARDEFLSIASHELKTPLTSLSLNAQIMKKLIQKNDSKVFAPEKIKFFIDQTDKQTKRLNRLVEDILDISRIRTGKLKIEKNAMSLKDLLTDLKHRFDEQFQIQTGSELSLEINDEIHGEWDRMRLEQVMNNLLTNALRYGKNRPVGIKARKTKTKVRIEVRDEGIGIAPENREKIFDRFERAGISANEISGLGLGLFITRQIVLAHGGKIWVEENADQGSTFVVQLPLKEKTESEGIDVL